MINALSITKQVDIADFIDYIYTRLPFYYKVDDKNLGSPQQRYLQSLCGYDSAEDAYSIWQENTTGTDINFNPDASALAYTLYMSNIFPFIIDPERTSDTLLSFLFRTWGIRYNRNVNFKWDDSLNDREGGRVANTTYNRNLLSIIGRLVKYNGTETAVKYLISSLMGHDVATVYHRDYENNECVGRFLDILIQLDDDESFTEANKQMFEVEILNDFIQDYLPFYIRPWIAYTYPVRQNDITAYAFEELAESADFTLPLAKPI